MTRWTPDEEAWLHECYPTMHADELMESHAERFGTVRTAKAIGSRAKVLGIRKADGYQRNPPRMWTEDKVSWFVGFVPGHSEPEISAEHERLYGFPLSESQIANAKAKFGVRSGTHGGRFEKGHVPSNKGKKWDEFMSPEGQAASRRTQFRKGEVHGAAEKNAKPIGYERVDSRDGYVWVKVRDSVVDGIQRQCPGHFNENFRLKHHVVWEERNGPVPPHTMIVFADRDKRNFDPDNLVAVPRTLWSVISHEGWAYHDRASLEACMALAQLRKAVYRASCHPRLCRRCGGEFAPRYPNQRTCDACLGHGSIDERKEDAR